MVRIRPRFIAVAMVGLLAVLLTSCADARRPSVDEWLPNWVAVVDAFPTAGELGDPPDQDVCNHALGELRTNEGGLHPTPDRAIDDAVRNWVQIAESIVFECPPASQAIPNLDYAYGELERLEAEIDIVLTIDLEAGPG